MFKNPLYVSNRGGTINYFRGDTGFLYRVCSNHSSLYCNDLISAKVQLDRLESRKGFSSNQTFDVSNKYNQALRDLVESAAAPYLEADFVWLSQCYTLFFLFIVSLFEYYFFLY